MIRHLKHNEIDKVKWDTVIDDSPNKRVYAYSWWLDIACAKWEALILNDYEAVMPLPYLKWYGFHCLVQPIITQQLGVFSKNKIDSILTNQFVDSIPNGFKYIEIKLNTENKYTGDKYIKIKRINQELNLNKSYSDLFKDYARRTTRNIKKATINGLTVSRDLSVKSYIDFYQNISSQKLSFKNISIVESLVTESLKRNYGKLIGIQNKNNDLVAVAFYMLFQNRLFSFLIASNNEGKNNSAMYLIVDDQIKSNAGKDIIFDFTGSNLEGVAYFNNGFGALETYYQLIKRNNFSFPLNLIMPK